MALTLDGAAPGEIAEELGVPSEQVRSNLRLARQRIAKALKEFDHSEEDG